MSTVAVTAELAAWPRHAALAGTVLGLAIGPHVPLAFVAGASVALLVGARVATADLAHVLALAAVALLAGAVVGDARATSVTAPPVQPGSEGRWTVTLVGEVRRSESGAASALARLGPRDVLLRLPRWQPRIEAGVGARLVVEGRVDPADRFARGQRAAAVLRARAVRLAPGRRGGLTGAVDAVRRRAQRALQEPLRAQDGALLRGMVLGDDSAVAPAVRADFRASGLAHLTAASGQNVMLLAALTMALGALLGIGIQGRRWLVLGAIALYVPLAGSGPSIQRAGVMGAAGLVAALASRPAARWYAVGIAAAVTLALDPRSLEDPGWQLSFAAVAGIAALAPALAARLRRGRLDGPLLDAVAVTLAATIATAPIVAAHFDRVSLASLPANVAAVPAVAPAMWLGMVGAALGQVDAALAAPAVVLAGLPTAYLGGLAHVAAALPGAEVDVPPALVGAVCVAAVVAIRAGRRWRRRAGAVAVALAVAALLRAAGGGPALEPPGAGVLRATFLDVGQGDATLLQTAGATVLVDAGPPGGPILRRLRAAGVERLDLLVLTHGSADHLGGAPDVLRAMPVATLADGRDGDRSPVAAAVDPAVREHRVRRFVPRAGQRLRVGDLTLEVLWPPAHGPTTAAGVDPNDRAVVARVVAFGRRVLLTADAESEVLAPLRPGRVDVLKVSHHGSADAGLPALLEDLRPRLAAIEVGRDNSYGHPAPATVRALAAAVPVVRRTDRDGSIAVELDARRLALLDAGNGRG